MKRTGRGELQEIYLYKLSVCEKIENRKPGQEKRIRDGKGSAIPCLQLMHITSLEKKSTRLCPVI